LWLLPAPEAIRERGWEVLDGPERVESGWWDGGDARRDYYVIRLSQGETLWVYRDLRGGGWYRQGIFG
jgi:protein ImuB